MFILKKSFYYYFLNKEVKVLILLILLISLIIITIGSILTPVITSIIVAYFLQGGIKSLKQLNLSETTSYLTIYFIFLTLFITGCTILIPLLWQEFINLFNDLPQMIQQIKNILSLFMQQYQAYFSQEQVNSIVTHLTPNIQIWGKNMLSISISSIPGIIALIIYLILFPLLVFFFLKDHKIIISWFIKFIPHKHNLLKKIWFEMDNQLGNYIRGKILEIVLISLLTYIVFMYYKLNYSAILAIIVGFSSLIPIIGATLVIIPIILVGFIQLGLTNQLAYILIIYFIIQALDGYVLVPLLFSETINLHPVAIVISILIFGALWGFWGIFFAIPLATLIKTIINVWPENKNI
ncbi:MAG: AI-2E family transporter [Candidatus Azosocius agrarius]|nr:MAG: AI-2E family transporter [Gammaproteobacteria bacterium]